MTAEREGLAEEIAGVLHRAFHDHWNPSQSLNLYADSPLWRAQAAALADLLAARDRRVRVEALREAADDDRLPFSDGVNVSRLRRWLRSRADWIEADA